MEPAIEKSQKNKLDLHDLNVCMIVNPLDRMSDTIDSTTGAHGCDREIRLHRIRAATLRFHAALSFFKRGSVHSPTEQGEQT